MCKYRKWSSVLLFAPHIAAWIFKCLLKMNIPSNWWKWLASPDKHCMRLASTHRSRAYTQPSLFYIVRDPSSEFFKIDKNKSQQTNKQMIRFIWIMCVCMEQCSGALAPIFHDELCLLAIHHYFMNWNYWFRIRENYFNHTNQSVSREFSICDSVLVLLEFTWLPDFLW